MTKKTPSSATLDLDRHFGQRMAECRRQQNMSAADLDDAIAAAPGSIARIESGNQSLTAAQLFALSRALKVPVPHFFEGVSRPAHGAATSPPPVETVNDAEQFLHAYYQVPDAQVRRDILALLRAAAGDEGETV
jgi:transcriptional regulator with XRE-family HTH domain